MYSPNGKWCNWAELCGEINCLLIMSWRWEGMKLIATVWFPVRERETETATDRQSACFYEGLCLFGEPGSVLGNSPRPFPISRTSGPLHHSPHWGFSWSRLSPELSGRCWKCSCHSLLWSDHHCRERKREEENDKEESRQEATPGAFSPLTASSSAGCLAVGGAMSRTSGYLSPLSSVLVIGSTFQEHTPKDYDAESSASLSFTVFQFPRLAGGRRVVRGMNETREYMLDSAPTLRNPWLWARNWELPGPDKANHRVTKSNVSRFFCFVLFGIQMCEGGRS